MMSNHFHCKKNRKIFVFRVIMDQSSRCCKRRIGNPAYKGEFSIIIRVVVVRGARSPPSGQRGSNHMRYYKHPQIEFILIAWLICLLLNMVGSVRADFTFGIPTKIGPMVNSWRDDYSPCLSADGLSLYFASTRLGGLGGYDLWVSTRETTSDDWGPAENLGPFVNSPDEDVSPAVSPNDLELYFTSFRAGGQGGADIWVAKRQTTTEPWGQPENLGPLINSPAHEVTPSLSADGLKLYFAFGQENGEARSSLYVANRDTIDAPWSIPVRLDPVINSENCQWNPTISSDGLLLFFSDYWNSAARSEGIGATDIWLTMRASKESDWISPVNLGQPVNTSFIEDSPMISPDGSTLYFSSDAFVVLAGWNNLDIWEVPIRPLADFDDNEYVGLSDLLRLAESWGQNDPLCDIGPMPWGDGVVDVADLDVLVDHWGPTDIELINHWRFDETEGMTAHDSTGYKDANLVGDPIWQPDEGKVGGALLFDGINDYVTTPPIEWSPLSGSITISAWIKGGRPGQAIISEELWHNWLTTDLEGNLATTVMTDGPTFFQSSQICVTDGQWHHVGIVLDAQTNARTIYIDGVEGARNVNVAEWESLRDIGALYIGASSFLQSSAFWNGFIDDVRILSRAVNPIEPQTFRRPIGQKGL